MLLPVCTVLGSVIKCAKKCAKMSATVLRYATECNYVCGVFSACAIVLQCGIMCVNCALLQCASECNYVCGVCSSTVCSECAVQCATFLQCDIMCVECAVLQCGMH